MLNSVTLPATAVLKVDPQAPEAAIIAQAAALIRSGGLVAFPTETVYGLGADALNATAVERIFAAKERPAYDPLIVHVADFAALSALVQKLPEIALQLANAFWPGPLTLVLPKAAIVPDIVTAGGATVAVRCPAHPVAQALIRAAATPIAAPSANLFSHTSPTTADHVISDLNGRIELILDGGSTQIGVESTVLDLRGPGVVVLRPGAVTVDMVHAVLGQVEVRTRPSAQTEVLASPGLLQRHYAPHAELRLFSGPDAAVVNAIREMAADEMAAGRTVVLLLPDEEIEALKDLGCLAATLGPRADLAAMAQRLYAGLRGADHAGAAVILARTAPAQGLGLAINDRLRRAARIVIALD